MKTRILLLCSCLAALLVPSACLGYPEGADPVKGFELQRYLGTWYEIARLDHSFERGLQEGTATYSMREDGGVRVLNRGYSPKKQEWSEAEGKAYFVREEDEGYLEVCFFWPFYGSYVIYDMDLDRYEWAAVCSSNHSYLWLLSRKPYVSKDVKRRFLERAKKLGFDTDALIFVEHGKAKQRRR